MLIQATLLLLYIQSGLATLSICSRLRVEAPAAASCSCEGVYTIQGNSSVPTYHNPGTDK